MSNLPLKALVWFERKDNNVYGNIKHCAQGAGIFYTIMPTSKDVEICWGDSIDGSSGHRTLKDVDEAKKWDQSTHYPHKMQPYVAPTPAWISVDDRLPEDDQSYICRLENGGFVRYLVVMFFSQLNRFAIQNENVTHWMPIPEFSKQGE